MFNAIDLIFSKTISNIQQKEAIDRGITRFDEISTEMNKIESEFTPLHQCEYNTSISPEQDSISDTFSPKRKRNSSLANRYTSELSGLTVSLPTTPSSPEPTASTSASARRRLISNGESDSFDGARPSDVRTELLKSLLVKRAQPKEQLLTPLQNLFLSLADMVASFPETSQIETKQKIFQLITEQELKLAFEKQQVQSIDSSPVRVISIDNSQYRFSDQLRKNLEVKQEVCQEDIVCLENDNNSY